MDRERERQENNMSKLRIALLIAALVAGLGVILSLEAATVHAAPDVAAAYDAAPGPGMVAMPDSANVYVSEDALWSEFFHAADYHDAEIASKLLRMINLRHEHRVRLPR
jgi:hypothetical protein